MEWFEALILGVLCAAARSGARDEAGDLRRAVHQ